MDKQKHAFIELLVISTCLTIAVGQCPDAFNCPVGQICVMARQGYGQAAPECIRSGGKDASSLHQSMQRGQAGLDIGADYRGLNHLRGSRFNSGLYRQPYRRFQEPYIRNNWNPMTYGFRYPLRRSRYPLRYRRPVHTFGGYVPTVSPGFRINKFGPPSSIVDDMSTHINPNITVDNNNTNVKSKTGSSNVVVNQVGVQTQSAKQTPVVEPVVPIIHPGLLVPVQVHNFHDPSVHQIIADPKVDVGLMINPLVRQGIDQPVEPSVDQPVEPSVDSQLGPSVDPHTGRMNDPLARPEVDPHAEPSVDPHIGPFVDPHAEPVGVGHTNQGIPLGFAKPRVV